MLKNWEQIYGNSGAIQAVCEDHLQSFTWLFFILVIKNHHFILSWDRLRDLLKGQVSIPQGAFVAAPGGGQEWHKYCLILGVLAILFSFLIEKMEWESHLRWWLTAHELLALWRSLFLGIDCGGTDREQHQTGNVKSPQNISCAALLPPAMTSLTYSIIIHSS